MACFACSGSSTRSRRTIKQNDELAQYKSKFKFIENELLEFRQRFYSSANAKGHIDKASFMESMGVLGLDTGSSLSNRIFHIMDKNKNGFIMLGEYLDYFNILIYGTQEEKDEVTFYMIDQDGKGYFEFEEFYEMITSMLQTWSNITGHNYNIYSNKKLNHFLENVFGKFDIKRQNRVDLGAFKVAVAREPELLEIFDYFNEGIIDAVQPPNEFDRHQNELVQDLEDLYLKLENLKTLAKPRKRRTSVENQKDLPVSPFGGSDAGINLMINSTDGRRSSIFQTLGTKIRKTALFEHLADEGEPRGDGTEIRRPRSAMFKVDDLLGPNSMDRMRRSEHHMTGRHSLFSQFNVLQIRNSRTMDGASPPKSPLASAQPEQEPFETAGKRNTSIGSSRNASPEASERAKPGSVFSVNTSPRESGQEQNEPRGQPQKDLPDLKRKITEEEDREDDVLQLDDILPAVEIYSPESGETSGGLTANRVRTSLKSQSPFKLRPEALDIEDLEPLTTTPGNNVNPKHSYLDEMKMCDSVTVPKVKISGLTPKISLNGKTEIPPMRISAVGQQVQKKVSLGENEEDRLNLIQLQIDMITAETRRIIEELHLKKKQQQGNGKNEKTDEEKKIEMLREVTAQNIPKSTSNKTKKGNFVFFGHQNWNLVVNVMLGIQMAVKSAVERPEALSFKDFKLKYIFELVPKRTNEMKDTFKICTFFDYAPNVFLEIRKFFGIKNEDYLKSIGPESMLNGLIKGNLSTLAELTSSGKSGSFFYYSADGKYTLKTISRDEFHFKRKILKNYYNHMMTNPNSLVIKFFGLHKIRFMKGPQRKTKLYFVIMANVFHTSREIHIRYDLKGSTQGRTTKETDPSIAKKDLDIRQSKEKITLTKDLAETFISVMEKDAKFFEENGIIDYSLLFGIHYLEHDEMSTKDLSHKKPIEFKSQSKDGVLSGDGTKIYFFGIIDILTQFNAKKRAEYMIKRVAYGKGISAVPPPQYAGRFKKFIKELVEIQ